MTTNMSLSALLFPPCPLIPTTKHQNLTILRHRRIPTASFRNPNSENFIISNIVSIAVVATLTSPLSAAAIPSLNSQTPPLSSTTPFSQSKNLQIGLEDGKIRACPSTNPSCVSTNPKSLSSTFPWVIPANASENAIQKLQEAILKTQRNAMIKVVENTPDGQYLEAEVDDGGFGRDVLEFLVKGDVVAYRCMATKVTYVYPFTTAFGDSKGQEERMNKIIDQLGWFAPSLESMDD